MTDSTTTSDRFELAGYPVRRIGYGAMQLPGKGVFGPPRDHDEAIRVLRRAVELGVNHIDTAQYYGPDVANELIREALHPYPEDLAIVTKLGARRDGAGKWLPAHTPAELRAGVEENLRTLGTDRLAAANLRLLDDDGDQDSDRVPLTDQLEAMVAMRDEGLIAGVGISNANIDEVRIAIDTADIVCVQNAYSLLDRSNDDVLDLCTEHGIAYVPFFPLGSAFAHLPKVTDDDRVRRIADRIGATPAQVGLAWLLARADNILLIPGTSSVDHLEQNLATAEVQLSPEDLFELS